MQNVRKRGREAVKKNVQTIYRGIDILTAVLILTGQITNRGVFISGEQFSLPFAGPITGRTRKVSTIPQGNLILDTIAIIAAFLLILGEVNVIGILFASGGFTLVVSGPPFGAPKTEAYVPEAISFFSEYRDMVMKKWVK